jgi:GTPase SAR1 family protein
MLGPSGVGKTSVLATMNNELARISDPSSFDLRPTGATSNRLRKAFVELRGIKKLHAHVPIPATLEHTEGPVEHSFEVLFGDRKELDLVFWDTRGATMFDVGELGNELKTTLSGSCVIFNVLDAAVLMEGDACLSEEYNGHQRIRELLLDLNGDSDRLVVFVLTKCERWLRAPESLNETNVAKLIERFEQLHKPVLNLIQKRENMAGVVIPVQTLGCVEFSRTQRNQKTNQQEFIFVRTPDADFAPRDVDQPLRYALAFALFKNHVGRGWWDWIFDWLLGRDAQFIDSLRSFAKKRRKYKRYGNKSLFKVDL